MLKAGVAAIGGLFVLGLWMGYTSESAIGPSHSATQTDAAAVVVKSQAASTGLMAASVPSPAPLRAAAMMPAAAPAGTAATTTDLVVHEGVMVPLPAPVNAELTPAGMEVLWQTRDSELTPVDGIPAAIMQAQPGVVDTLRVGQRLQLPIPQLGKTIEADLVSTHNQLSNVQVFKGPVVSGAPDENIIITKGKQNTYVIVATRKGVYSAVIDNSSGRTSLVNEAEINARKFPHDDTLSVDPVQMPSPEHS